MLACHPRRQSNFDFYPPTDNLPSPSPSHSNLHFFNRLPTTACTPSPSDFDGKSINHFQQSPVTSHYESLDPEGSHYLASATPITHQPEIRIEQSTPAPLTTAGFQHSTPVDVGAYSWTTLDGGDTNSQMVATAAPNLQAAVLNRKARPHQRAASSSSIGSSGSSSPYLGHATSFPYTMAEQSSINTASKLSHNFSLDGSRLFGNHLPTPTQTPTQDSFISHPYSNTNANFHNQSLDSATAVSMTMNRMMDQEEDVPGMSHSGRHSVSSIGQEPSTPHTIGGDYEVGLRVPTNGEINFKVKDWIDNYLRYDDEADTLPHTSVPKFDRTMNDMYGDEGLYPAAATSVPVAGGSGARTHKNFLTPHPNQVREFLQAAQIARSQSPSTTISRDISPFRPDSPWATAVRLQSAAQSRESQKTQSYRTELGQHMSPPDNNAPKTISPKDAMLEYRPEDEESKMPLFPDAASFNQYGAQGTQPQYNSAGAWRQTPTSNFSTGQMVPTSHQQSAAFNFASPAAQQFTQGMVPFVPQNYRTASSMSAPKQDDTPDFPAHLTSMESSASEAPMSSSTSINMNNNGKVEAQRPEGSSPLADTGTYTCTYHGCSLRFETPQKLQRHKREGHRQVAAQQQHTPGVGSGMTSAALAARNSQQGPHKCERINPTTGKPCNAVFSRPYDLTRHEDTIHNVRKQKVRCALCVEEKTFSRNDALTRHMRVVHPEVDFPGKHRRRGEHE